jgi:hypothetical protein
MLIFTVLNKKYFLHLGEIINQYSLDFLTINLAEKWLDDIDKPSESNGERGVAIFYLDLYTKYSVYIFRWFCIMVIKIFLFDLKKWLVGKLSGVDAVDSCVTCGGPGYHWHRGLF